MNLTILFVTFVALIIKDHNNSNHLTIDHIAYAIVFCGWIELIVIAIFPSKKQTDRKDQT